MRPIGRWHQSFSSHCCAILRVAGETFFLPRAPKARFPVHGLTAGSWTPQKGGSDNPVAVFRSLGAQREARSRDACRISLAILWRGLPTASHAWARTRAKFLIAGLTATG